ncbi:MAG: hypothetical protein M9919_13700 [Burkholderiaceae bacterium]|nr:hypothetical protein [Burkholderiaceae bacterium]
MFPKNWAAALLIACLSVATTSAQAAGKSTGFPALDTYRDYTNGSFYFCQVQVDTYLINKEIGRPAETPDCASLMRDGSVKRYKEALETLPTAEAKGALKEYQVKLLTAIDSVAPQMGERRIGYEARLQRAKTELREAWVRLELEL